MFSRLAIKITYLDLSLLFKKAIARDLLLNNLAKLGKLIALYGVYVQLGVGFPNLQVD